MASLRGGVRFVFHKARLALDGPLPSSGFASTVARKKQHCKKTRMLLSAWQLFNGNIELYFFPALLRSSSSLLLASRYSLFNRSPAGGQSSGPPRIHRNSLCSDQSLSDLRASILFRALLASGKNRERESERQSESDRQSLRERVEE